MIDSGYKGNTNIRNHQKKTIKVRNIRLFFFIFATNWDYKYQNL